MLTFDKDDNDDDLNFEDGSSNPSKPASPFNRPPLNSEANKPAPRTPSGTVPFSRPSLPSKVEAPSGFPSRPVSRPTEVKKPETRLPERPASRPAAQLYDDPQSVKQPEIEVDYVEDVSEMYESPALEAPELDYVEPPQNQQVQLPPVEPIAQEPQRLTPTYEPGYYQTHPYNQNPQHLPSPEMNFDPNYNPNALPPQPLTEEEPAKGKKGKKAKPSKPDKKQKATKENAYAGARKKFFWIRVIVFLFIAILMIAGLRAIFIPSSGPSRSQVEAAAQSAVNYTGFPTASGEQFAIDFTRAYLNFDNKDAERKATLLRFASEDLVNKIEIKTLSSEEYRTQNPGASYTDYVVAQTISYGPYVVDIKNLDEQDSVFTVKVGLNSGSVYYIDVPVKYDPEQYSLTLAGPPSFVKPIQNSGKTATTDYTADFGSGDQEIQKAFSSDLEAYLRAWASSDSTIINRYTLENATDNAKRGLQSSVVFTSLDKFTVESQDDARPNTANARRAEITVTWTDPKTGLKYPQQYRMLLGLNPENNWSIYDIENFSVLN